MRIKEFGVDAHTLRGGTTREFIVSLFTRAPLFDQALGPYGFKVLLFMNTYKILVASHFSMSIEYEGEAYDYSPSRYERARRKDLSSNVITSVLTKSSEQTKPLLAKTIYELSYTPRDIDIGFSDLLVEEKQRTREEHKGVLFMPSLITPLIL